MRKLQVSDYNDDPEFHVSSEKDEGVRKVRTAKNSCNQRIMHWRFQRNQSIADTPLPCLLLFFVLFSHL